MKKFLPIILLVIGIVIFIGVYLFIVRAKKNVGTPIDEDTVAELPFEKRPFVSLTPTKDGHYLLLSIQKVDIEGASSLDYELIYQVPDGPTQGVPGTVDIKGKSSFETDLLLGSESSGKFRYDAGVEQGSLTLRFRNDEGKLIARFSTEFRLLSDISDLVLPDSGFKVSLDKKSSNFFVLMDTWGVLAGIPDNQNLKAGPFGLFSSGKIDESAKVEIQGAENIYVWTGNEWIKAEEGQTIIDGIYIGTSG